MIRLLRELRYDLLCAKAIARADELPYYAETLDSAGVRQARQLIASVYAEKGVVPAASLQVDGTMSDAVDPYWQHSVYIGVRDSRTPERLLMAARLIRPTKQGGVHSLQLHIEQLRPAFRERILQTPLQEIAELAAYIKQPGLGPLESRIASMYLIRQLVLESQKLGIKTWVFGLRPELRAKYERLFGPALDRQGNQVQLGKFNAIFVPYSIDVERGAKRMLTASRLRPGSKAIAQFVAAAYVKKPDPFVETIKRRPPRIKPAH